MVDFYGTEFTKTREPRDMIPVAHWHGRVRVAMYGFRYLIAIAWVLLRNGGVGFRRTVTVRVGHLDCWLPDSQKG